MSQEDENVAMLRAGYAAWHQTKGDADVWLDILAEHVTWGSLGDGQPGMEFSKSRISKQEVVDYFKELTNDWSMEFYYVSEYVAQGDRVVALGECSWTNKRTKKTVTIPKVDVWKFENGKIVEFMEHFDTHTAIMASQD